MRAQEFQRNLTAIAECDDGETPVPQSIRHGNDIFRVGNRVVTRQIDALGLPGAPAGGEALACRLYDLAALQRRRHGEIPAFRTIQPGPAKAAAALFHQDHITELPQRQQPLGVAGEGADAGGTGAAGDKEYRFAHGIVDARQSAEGHIDLPAARIIAVLRHRQLAPLSRHPAKTVEDEKVSLDGKPVGITRNRPRRRKSANRNDNEQRAQGESTQNRRNAGSQLGRAESQGSFL